MKALLKRLGAPGARLNLGLQLFFAILFESVVFRVEFYVGWVVVRREGDEAKLFNL